jgi:hypothetical protein
MCFGSAVAEAPTVETPLVEKIERTQRQLVQRGAELLDLVYGPRWFRTEIVSLAEVKKTTEDMSFILNRLEGRREYLGYRPTTFEKVTQKALKQGWTFQPGELTHDASHPSTEFWGEEYGFFRNDERAAWQEAWVEEIRKRRYNRPTKRRLSTETATRVRRSRKAVN